MLHIVLHSVPRVGRANVHVPDGFEPHLLQEREAETWEAVVPYKVHWKESTVDGRHGTKDEKWGHSSIPRLKSSFLG